MSNGVPPPSTKPVWPIVVACLVLVAGIMVAAVFIGMNLSDSDDNDNMASRDDAPSYAAEGSGSKQKQNQKSPDNAKSDGDEQQTSDADESEPPEKSKDEKSDEKTDEKSDEPVDDSSESVPSADDPRLDCGSASTVLTTRTAEYGASICRTADGADIYRGMSVNIDGSLVLDATFDGATGAWVATNQTFKYIVDANTGHMTIRNNKTGEVYGSQPAIKFHTE